jgi:hypothetical protein
VGGLYDRENGPHSERLYQLLLGCGFEYQESDDEGERLQWTQTIRACMYFDNGMPLEDISTFYQQIYGETLQARPFESLKVMLQQLVRYTFTASDAYDLESAHAVEPDCEDGETDWFTNSQIFCPKPPTPLSFLDQPLFGGLLVFNLLTHFPNFLLGTAAFWRSSPRVRWLLLFCLAFYAYHAVVTANAGTLLSRYVTVTNPYTLIVLGVAVATLARHTADSRISLPLDKSTEKL